MSTQQQVIDRLMQETSEKLRDQEEQDVLGLLKAYQNARNDMESYVFQAFRDLGTKEWTISQVAAFGRDQALLNEINLRINQLKAEANGWIEDGMKRQLIAAADGSVYLLDQVTPQDVLPIDPTIPEPAVAALVNAPYEGAVYSQRIGMINDAMASDIRDELTQSMINGESMDEAADRVAGVIGADDFENLESYGNRASVIARTEIMRAQNLGRQSVYDANKKLMAPGGSVWVTTPDDRLCPWCMRRDGKTQAEIKKLPKGADPWGNKNEAPLHPYCRCTLAPKLKSWRDLTGLDMPEEFDDNERGYRNEDGKWSYAKVEDFDSWQKRRQEGSLVAAR